MRIALILVSLLFAMPAFAQDAPEADASAVAPGCGTDNLKFAVKSNSSTHPVSKPEPGKALVYFIQDDKYFFSRPRPTVKWGVDGNWVGATQANAYFVFSVDPGEHHLCSEWQTSVGPFVGRQASATHFIAKPDHVYYFVAQDLFQKDTQPAAVRLTPFESDEALLLMSKFSFSTSQPKK